MLQEIAGESFKKNATLAQASERNPYGISNFNLVWIQILDSQSRLNSFLLIKWLMDLSNRKNFIWCKILFNEKFYSMKNFPFSSRDSDKILSRQRQ